MREDSRQKVQAIIEETGGIKVRYLPYDWSTNASMHKAYQSSNLKASTRFPQCHIVLAFLMIRQMITCHSPHGWHSLKLKWCLHGIF
jgi:hypothetical protein